MAKREMSVEDGNARLDALSEVQETFPFTEAGFLFFAQVVINELIRGNPDLNRVQADICAWLFSGPKYRMVEAQRGQAKTTLTAIYAVFRLIHNPSNRILIFSAGGKMSKEIASFVIQIIKGLDFLWMLVPDENAGDRASVESFDCHWFLKGVDKSPSVKCLGVDTNAQGSRADILIADDIESMKNSRTVAAREILEDLTKEFESICAEGDILYLGTPQSAESIYNNLTARGYAIRIWPGRYPTTHELDTYGEMLAPMIRKDIEKNPELQTGGGLTGSLGRVTCPEMFTEEILIEKEISMGKAKFQLQYMLNTALTDEERYPLKPKHLVVAEFSKDRGPCLPIASTDERNRYHSVCLGNRYKLYRAVPNQYDYQDFEQTVMYIDPAGGGKNADETAYAVIKLIGAYVYITDIGGVAGGYEEEKLMKLVETAKRNNAKTVLIERNFGNGAHASMLSPLFEKNFPVTIEEVWETGQKELRIIDTIEPLLSSGRIIISPEVIEKDAESVEKYPVETRITYRLLHQMAMITRDKGALRHDDRLDALAGAIRYVVDRMDFDTQTVMEARRRASQVAEIKAWNDPSRRREMLTGVVEVSGVGSHNRFTSGVRKSGSRNRFN